MIKSHLNRGSLIRPLIIFLFAFFLYLPTVSYDFIRDDNVRIVNNPLVHEIEHLPKGLLSPAWPGNLYRPVSFLIDNLTFSLFGSAPRPFHTVNILLHAGVSLVLFLLLLRLTSPGPAFVAALIFLVHPVHSETVANIDHKSELLVAFFGLVAILCRLSNNLKPVYKHISSFFLLLLAFLSKENGLTFLVLFPLVLYYKRKLLIKDFVVLLVSLIVYLFLRYLSLGALVNVYTASEIDNILMFSGASDRILTGVLLLGKYLQLFLCPGRLSSDYSFAQILSYQSWDYTDLLICSVLITSLVAGIFYYSSVRSPVAYCGAWFLLSFSLTSNILFPIGTIFAERLLYLPSVGLALLAAALLINFKRPVVLILIIFALTLITFISTPRWRNIAALASNDILSSPDSVRVLHVYSQQQYRIGNTEKAIKFAKKALSLKPDYMPALKQLQVIYFQLDQYTKASEISDKLLNMKIKDVKVYSLAAWVFLRLEEYEKSDQYFKKSLVLDPQFQLSKIGLFALAVISEKHEQALSLENGISEEARNLQLYKEFSGRLKSKVNFDGV